jgi:hypothetical protein
MLKERAESILTSLLVRCREHYAGDLVSLVVYGSVGRGTHTFTSDIDILLIVKELPEGRMNRMRDFESVENRLNPELDAAIRAGWNVSLSPIIRTPEEVNLGGYLYLDMIDDARILNDRDDFFADYLQRLKAKLDEYGAVKKPFKGGYYWHIKPDMKTGEVIDV